MKKQAKRVYDVASAQEETLRRRIRERGQECDLLDDDQIADVMESVAREFRRQGILGRNAKR